MTKSRPSITIIASVTLVLALAGCSGGPNSDSTDDIAIETGDGTTEPSTTSPAADPEPTAGLFPDDEQWPLLSESDLVKYNEALDGGWMGLFITRQSDRTFSEESDHSFYEWLTASEGERWFSEQNTLGYYPPLAVNVTGAIYLRNIESNIEAGTYQAPAYMKIIEIPGGEQFIQDYVAQMAGNPYQRVETYGEAQVVAWPDLMIFLRYDGDTIYLAEGNWWAASNQYQNFTERDIVDAVLALP